MTSVQTSVGSLLLDMAEWDPGNEPRHHAKEHCSRIDVGKKQVNSNLNEKDSRLCLMLEKKIAPF